MSAVPLPKVAGMDLDEARSVFATPGSMWREIVEASAVISETTSRWQDFVTLLGKAGLPSEFAAIRLAHHFGVEAPLRQVEQLCEYLDETTEPAGLRHVRVRQRWRQKDGEVKTVEFLVSGRSGLSFEDGGEP